MLKRDKWVPSKKAFAVVSREPTQLTFTSNPSPKHAWPAWPSPIWHSRLVPPVVFGTFGGHHLHRGFMDLLGSGWLRCSSCNQPRLFGRPGSTQGLNVPLNRLAGNPCFALRLGVLIRAGFGRGLGAEILIMRAHLPIRNKSRHCPPRISKKSTAELASPVLSVPPESKGISGNLPILGHVL